MLRAVSFLHSAIFAKTTQLGHDLLLKNYSTCHASPNGIHSRTSKK